MNMNSTLNNETRAAKEMQAALLGGGHVVIARCHDGETRRIIRVRNCYRPARIVQGMTMAGAWYTLYGYQIE